MPHLDLFPRCFGACRCLPECVNCMRTHGRGEAAPGIVGRADQAELVAPPPRSSSSSHEQLVAQLLELEHGHHHDHDPDVEPYIWDLPELR